MSIKDFMTAMSLTVAYVITVVGSGGLLATGVYMLNSFFGLVPDAAPWQYGLTGLIYIICMLPTSVTVVKAYWGSF